MRKVTCGGKRKNVFIFRFSSKQRFSRLTRSTISEENEGLVVVYGMKSLSINEEKLTEA